MQQSKPLLISISKPCSQNWNDMQTDAKGKFCSSCQNTVIDFTYLSDTELYEYFKNLKTIPCGRFHASQLDRPLIPATVKRKKPWMIIYKPLAAALALFMMKFNATAGNKNSHPTTISPRQITTHSFITPASVTISGTVMHEEGRPLENAKIYIENSLVATTNKDGKYTFDFQVDGTPRPYNITIAAEGMTTIVRTYHPSMLSTTFDVTMTVFKDDCCNSIIIGAPGIHPIKPISFTFSRKSSSLKIDDDINALIATYATELRNHPELIVVIIGHTGVEPLDKARQERLRNYFVEKEGIAEERFIFVTEISKDPEVRDVVELRAKRR